jgi:hypothetical protein
MLNIYFTNKSRGPGKVYKNLISGLNKLNVKYQLNNPNPSSNDIISYDETAIQEGYCAFRVG